MANRTVLLILILLTVRGAGWAGQVQVVVNHPLEPEELVVHFEIASDGRYVTYEVQPSLSWWMWPITRLWAAPLDSSTGRTAWPLSTLPYACVYSAHITPDGARVIYRADQDRLDVVELYCIPIEGGAPVKLNDALTTGGNVVGEPSSDILDPFDPRRGPGFRITPDSQRVVYQADATTVGMIELFVVPVAGGPVTRLSGPMPVGGGLQSDGLRISPDGTRVVYLAAQDTADGIDLYSVPIGGGASTRLSAEPLIHPYDYPEPLFIRWPTFEITTDSTHVVYWADPDSDGVRQWWRVPIEGGEAPVATTKPTSPGGGIDFPVPEGYSLVSGPVLMPNGESALATLRPDGVHQADLWQVWLDGHSAKKISGAEAAGGDILSFEPTPDGSMVLYDVSDRETKVRELYKSFNLNAVGAAQWTLMK